MSRAALPACLPHALSTVPSGTDTDGGIPLYYFGSVQSAEVGGFVHVKECKDTMDIWKTYRKTAGAPVPQRPPAHCACVTLRRAARELAESQEQSGPGRLTPLFDRVRSSAGAPIRTRAREPTDVPVQCVQRVKEMGRYHILVVLTDGDVEDEREFGAALGKVRSAARTPARARPSSTDLGSLAQASCETPMSVVVVGIGDGPFGQIAKYDAYMPPEKK